MLRVRQTVPKANPSAASEPWFNEFDCLIPEHENGGWMKFLKFSRSPRNATQRRIARQNYGNIYINNNGGFSGFMSRIRYYDYAVNPLEIEYEVKKGPSAIKVKSFLIFCICP